jgi:hypothetical protein
MHLASRLLAVLALCLVAIALPAVPVQAVCGGYFITLSPLSGAPGTTAVVNGQDFQANKYVDIYYDATIVGTGKTDMSGDFTIAFAIPEDCKGPHQVLAEVGADIGTVRVFTYFTIRPGLTVSPEKGPIGTNVTVQGRGFASNEHGIELVYYANDSYETLQRNIVANAQGSWETSLQIPTSTRGEHKIDAQGAESQLYEVKEAVFRVTAETSLDKSSGIAGDTITMTGGRFAAYEKAIKILFGDQAVVTGIKASSNGDWETSFKVPDMPTGTHTVTAEGEQTRKEDVGELTFDIQSYILLSPAEGHVGTDVTVTGHGFAAGEDLDITYDGSLVAAASPDDKGTFEVSFTVPASQHGEHKIAAGYAGENHANCIFTLESDPPNVPIPASPANRSRLGLAGKVTPTFEWSAVSDDSGVLYSLQIATSADFSAPSVIVSVTGLTEASYTPTEALSNGTYYWILQAVDGAENESGWTAPRSFRVGLLPLWGFIAAIVAAVILLALAIRALVVRRSVFYDRW